MRSFQNWSLHLQKILLSCGLRVWASKKIIGCTETKLSAGMFFEVLITALKISEVKNR